MSVNLDLRRADQKGCRKAVQTPVGFLIALGFTTIVHGMVVNGIMNVNVSTIERRYHLSSYESGLISSSYDVAFCVLCPLVAYYGNHHHRPRIMVLGLLVFIFGCIVNTIPHFVEEYSANERNYTDLCKIRNESRSVDKENDHFSYFSIFVLGGILLGVGSIPIITLGVAYLEDSTTKERAASYIGLVGGLSAFGSVIGYLLGGYMLSHHADFYKVESNGNLLAPGDPMWVGAWWMSLLVAICFALSATMSMCLFPKRLPGIEDVLVHRESETHAKSGSKITERINFGKTFRDFPTAIKLLLGNPTFLFTIVAASFESFLLNGFAVFLPKLLQNQFHITQTEAALMAGSVSVPGAIVGHIVSGYLVRKFSMKAPSILKAASIATVISGLLTPCLILHCPQNMLTKSEASGVSSKSVCNTQCDCDQEIFRPVCGNDNVEYFSACHAGCSEKDPDSLVFYNCSCVLSQTNITGVASKGSCATKCNLLILFLILLFLLISLSFAVLTPSVVVVMRCVPYSQKSFGVGIQWFFIRIIGSIPSPLVIGAVFDASCAIWRIQDGERGSCWLYDSNIFAQSAVWIAVICKFLTLICYTMAYRLYKPENPEYSVVRRSENLAVTPLQLPEIEFSKI